MTTPPQSPGDLSWAQMATPPEPKRRSRAGLWIGLGAAVIVAAAGGALFLDSRSDDGAPAAAASASSTGGLGNPLRGAANSCDTQKMGTRVEDDGKTLIIDNTGDEDSPSASVDVITLQCLLGALSTPESVKAQMFATRALDGRQEATWDRFSASWSYHPNTGLDLIVTLTN